MTTDTYDLFRRLALALAIGLLIGLERGWRERDDREGERATGLRTHALAGLLGGIWGAIARETAGSGGVLALGIAFATFSVTVAVYRFREIVREGTYGATTVVAAMLAFALGAFAVLGEPQLAAAAGVAATGLLALKAMLHAWVQRLTWNELRSGLVLLAMTFILLPLLPDRTIDPWQSLNPHALWLMTILIAALSFAGYIAIKFTGDGRGVILTGLAGGLLSSTAVTLSLARMEKDKPALARMLAAGMVTAAATMAARVLVVAGLLNAEMLGRLAVPVGAFGLAMAACALLLAWPSLAEHSQIEALDVSNPFDLLSVLQLGALLAVVSLAAGIVTRSAGDAGVYALAAVSGLADVDALTISMANLAHGTPTLVPTGVTAILIAVAVNTVAKIVLCRFAGGHRTSVWLGLASTVAIAAGLAAHVMAAAR